MSGLNNETENKIREVFSQFEEIDKAVLYGSRAKGNYKDGSDIDLTLFGKKLNIKVVYKIIDKLEELYLPYSFDISIFEQIDNNDLKDHINRVGLVFYKKNNSLPTGWTVEKLGDVCEFFNGLWEGKKPPFQEVGVIRNTNFTKDCRLDYSNIIYLDVEQSQFKKRKLEYGDIILEKSGGGEKQPVGRVVIFDKKDGDFSFSNFTSVIRIKNAKNIDFSYLYKYLFFVYIFGITEKMQNRSIGIRNLKFDEYKEIEIPIPPLAEQKRIVSLLDKTFTAMNEIKENTEKNLKNAREVFESYLNSVFENRGEDWDEKTLGDVCKIFNGGTPATNIKEFWDGDNLWITPKDMGKLNSIYVDNTERKITDLGLKNSSAKILPINSIILSSRAPIGHLAINKKPISTNQGCKGLVPKKNTEVLFIYYFLKKSVSLLNELGSGTTFKEISSTKLFDVSIPFPSLKEQKRIVEKLDALQTEIKKLEAIYKKKLECLKEMKKSVLQKAFTGEV